MVSYGITRTSYSKAMNLYFYRAPVSALRKGCLLCKRLYHPNPAPWRRWTRQGSIFCGSLSQTAVNSISRSGSSILSQAGNPATSDPLPFVCLPAIGTRLWQFCGTSVTGHTPRYSDGSSAGIRCGGRHEPTNSSRLTL